ncbi:hypothetical protein H7169_03055 [Candidatus Gracilibacteria bacterium]|nr:hypothetical protein [Candidatus Gracilibacteria bacterium]
MVSDIFVKKICEKMGEILTKKNLIDLWLRSGGSHSRVAYAMSILLGRRVVERVASGIYLVQNETRSIEIGQKYWQIISKLIGFHTPSGGVIGGEKTLEIHLSNYSIPDVLIIYTRDTALRIKLSDGREVHFRTLVSGPKTGKKNLWRTIVDNAISVEMPEKIQICGREFALLEALSLRRHDVGIEEANIARFLRSFASQLDRDILGNLTRLRYIRPLNRLRVLARDLGYSDLYAMTLEIIRDEGGGCYLNL